MNHEELANHERVQASMDRTAEARPEPRALMTTAECTTCGSTTTATAEQRASHGWVVATVGARRVEFCGQDCVVHFNKRAPRMNLPRAVVTPAAPATSTPWVDVKPARTTRTGALQCERCPTRQEIHQTRNPDGSWSPDAAKVAEIGGWICVAGHTFCGPGCAGIDPRDVKPIPAVERVNDASYQAQRASAHGGPVAPGLAGREVPDRPPRKVTR